MNSPNDAFSVFQKAMARFLKAEGFRKAKLFFVKDMSDACCYFYLEKLRGYSDETTVRFRAQCFLRFNALDLIFRPDVDQDIDLTVTDIGHIFRLNDSGNIELDGGEDMVKFLGSFQSEVKLVLQDFERKAHLDWLASNCMSVLGERPNIMMLMKCVVAAKIAGMSDVHRELCKAIEEHPGGDNPVAKFYLEKLKSLSFL